MILLKNKVGKIRKQENILN